MSGKPTMRARVNDDPFVVEADFYSITDDARIECRICPRRCRLREGQRGLCFIRAARGRRMVLTTYGLAAGLSVDPIEKKPLYHFLPGSSVLSFGTAGCNLTCKYCQNWHLSRAKEVGLTSTHASPEKIASMAAGLDARSVAFTYNDPTVFLEYAVDVANECRARGIFSVAVTAGYILPEPRAALFASMDAVNIDLKAFSEAFYRRLTGGHLAPVLETIEYVRNETSAWLELTTLLIPGENDSDQEIEALARWVVERLGPDVPLHFSGFHPAFKMLDHPPTPRSSLVRARRIAIEQGVRHVYTGNVRDREGSTTFCHACKKALIRRDGFDVVVVEMKPDGSCASCGARCPGFFQAKKASLD